MANFTTLKMADRDVPNVTGAPTQVFHKIDAAKLASFPGINDTIEFFDLPLGARLLDAGIRVPGDIGAATSTLQLQEVRNAVAADITATVAATAAGSTRMNVAPPPKDTTYKATIRAIVETAALDAAGDIEVWAEYINP